MYFGPLTDFFPHRRVKNMVRIVFGFSVLLGALAQAQAQYPPPPPYGYGYGSGGGTVAGNNMNGMANMISAKGSYNVQTSEAAINMTQAQSNEIKNRQEYTNAYFDMRATNRAATAAERGPRPTAQQLARVAAQGAPKPISPGDLNPVTGQLSWPDLLQDDQFKQARADVEKLVAKQVSQGRLGYVDQKEARVTVNSMFADLKAEVKDVPPQDYVESRTFLRSLVYSLSKTELE
jgi:hypothetical protein